MQQPVAQITAGCNKQNVVFNNRLLELQPAVMLQFCNITAGCYLNHWLLHTIFCLLSACWIKTNGMIYIPIMFCPLTEQCRFKWYQIAAMFLQCSPPAPIPSLRIFFLYRFSFRIILSFSFSHYELCAKSSRLGLFPVVASQFVAFPVISASRISPNSD